VRVVALHIPVLRCSTLDVLLGSACQQRAAQQELWIESQRCATGGGALQMVDDLLWETVTELAVLHVELVQSQ
jgi:hypothetical protein